MIPKFIALQFKKPSGLFGKFTGNLMAKANRRNYEELVGNMKISSNDKILEIGYGPGIGINLIAQNGNSCIIHGIDFSDLMYKKATKLNRQFISENKVKLFHADFLASDTESNYYDKIFCLNVTYFWDNLQAPFQKIISALKSNGTFCFYMAHKDFLIRKKPPDSVFNKYSIEEIVEALKNVGFSKIDYYYKHGYFVSAEK